MFFVIHNDRARDLSEIKLHRGLIAQDHWNLTWARKSFQTFAQMATEILSISGTKSVAGSQEFLLRQSIILYFRSYWPIQKNFISTIAMKTQLNTQAQSDFYWPDAIGPVLKLQTGRLLNLIYIINQQSNVSLLFNNSQFC